MNGPSLKSTHRPLLHSYEIPIFKGFITCDIEETDHNDANDFVDMGKNSNNSNNDFEGLSFEAILFDQEELSDLIRDLNLSNESADLLGSRLKEINLKKEKMLHFIEIKMLTLSPTSIKPTCIL